MSGLEPVLAVRRETISPVSDRATGRLTYEVGVGASGAVYLSVVAKPLFVSVSLELVPIARVRTLLAEPLATGEPFETRLLVRAFARRAKQNSLVLADVLCHEGLLRPAVEAPKMHVCAGDWEDWAFVQRDRAAQLDESEASVEGDARPARASGSGNAPIVHASGPPSRMVLTHEFGDASDTDSERERNTTLSRLA